MAIVIEIPDEFKSLAPSVEGVVETLERRCRATGAGRSVDHAALEREIGEAVREVERQAQGLLLSALDVDAPFIEADGRRFRRIGRETATYRTLAGEVPVERALYRPVGERNGKVVDPVSLRAGTVGSRWTPAAAQAMAHFLAMGTAREAAEAAAQAGRLPYHATSFARIAHEVGEHYMEHRADVEAILADELEIPAEAASISVGLDRTAVPMEEPRSRPRGRPKKNAPKNPVSRIWRMGWCATVTLHDEDGEALHTIRYGRMPDAMVEDLCEALYDDVARIVARRSELVVTLLCDGAHELWELLEERFTEKRLGVPVFSLVDLWHLVEKLAAAAAVLYGEEAAVEMQRWKMKLLNHDNAVRRIRDTLLDSGKEWVKVGGNHPVHEAITYLTNHEARMSYAEARRMGRPLGSGNLEATCKSLVGTRMKRPGARWKHETGEHIIELRALQLSDRWDAAMHHTLKPLRKTVRAVA